MWSTTLETVGKWTAPGVIWTRALTDASLLNILTSLTGDYSGSSSSEEEEDDVSPKEVVLKNSAGQSDFRVKNIKIAPYGRKEIEMAEQGTETVM